MLFAVTALWILQNAPHSVVRVLLQLMGSVKGLTGGLKWGDAWGRLGRGGGGLSRPAATAFGGFSWYMCG